MFHDRLENIQKLSLGFQEDALSKCINLNATMHAAQIQLKLASQFRILVISFLERWSRHPSDVIPPPTITTCGDTATLTQCTQQAHRVALDEDS